MPQAAWFLASVIPLVLAAQRPVTIDIEDAGHFDDMRGVETIRVRTGHASIDLRPSEDHRLHYEILGTLHWSVNAPLPQVLRKAQVARAGRELSIAFGVAVVSPYTASARLVIYVPTSRQTVLDLESGNGDIRLKGLEVQRVQVDAAGGDIALEGLSADWVTVKAEVGDVRLAVSNIQSLKVMTKAGEVRITRVNAATTTIETASGDTHLDGWKGELSHHTESGEVVARLDAEAKGRMSFSSKSGDIHVDLPAKLGVDLRASSASGVVRSDLPLVLEGLRQNQVNFKWGGGLLALDLSTRSGDISLNTQRAAAGAKVPL